MKTVVTTARFAIVAAALLVGAISTAPSTSVAQDVPPTEPPAPTCPDGYVTAPVTLATAREDKNGNGQVCVARDGRVKDDDIPKPKPDKIAK